MHHTVRTHLIELRERISGAPTSPAFAERYNLVWGLEDGHTPVLRSIAAPIYVTDLGVRRFDDPAVFYRCHAASAGVMPMNSDDIRESVAQAAPEDLARTADLTVLFFGDYEAVAQAVQERTDEILAAGDYATLVETGVVLAATRRPGSLTLFDRATEVAGSHSQAYAAQHRAAAAEIKRLDAPADAIARLDRAATDHLTGDDEDTALDRALLDNLRALADLHVGGDRAARVAASHADIESSAAGIDGFLATTGISPDAASRAGRYRSQVAANRAQLALHEGDLETARDILADSATFAREHAYDYLYEALAGLAYTEYASGRHEDALAHATEAFYLYRDAGAVAGMGVARQILVGACHHLGRADAAAELAELLTADPLGFQGVGRCA